MQLVMEWLIVMLGKGNFLKNGVLTNIPQQLLDVV